MSARANSARAIYSAVVSFLVSLIVIMAGFECSTLFPGVAPFACPLSGVEAKGTAAEVKGIEAMAALFWAAAVFCTTLTGYGLAQFSGSLAHRVTLAGAVPYVLVGLVWARIGVSGNPADAHAWLVGYAGLLVLHVVVAHLGSRAGGDG